MCIPLFKARVDSADSVSAGPKIDLSVLLMQFSFDAEAVVVFCKEQFYCVVDQDSRNMLIKIIIFTCRFTGTTLLLLSSCQSFIHLGRTVYESVSN